MHKYQRHKLPRTPLDPDGECWCHACQALPASAFPAGERQYLCQQHLWQCCTSGYWATGTGCRLCRRCWKDAKLSCGQ